MNEDERREDELRYLFGSAAMRLARDASAYQALSNGLPVDRGRLDAALLAAIGEPVAGNPFELDELTALRIEALQPPVGVEEDELADGPVFVDLREREMRDVHWHDRPFLPSGELITNNADGDTGKGLIAVHYAARFSRGEFGNRRMVVFAVAEDDFETVLKPRLVAAEANLAYIRCVGWRRKGTDDALRIPDDVPVLEQHLATMNVGLFVIDPLLSHLSAKTNTHVDHEVKLALRPVMQLAHNLGCAALGNGHFGKEKGSGARRASMGSTAFTNTPRVGLAMAYDDEDPDVRVVEVIKSNIGPKGVGRNYRLKTVEVDGLDERLPLLVAESAATKSVDELIRAASWSKRIPGELVRELVLAELETGEKSRQYLDTVGEEKLGASHDTMYQSGLEPLRKEGLIAARKEGIEGGWFWRLKSDEEASL